MDFATVEASRDALLTYGASLFDWTNHNEGVLTLILFVITALIGWLSGIFGALRRRPRLQVDIIPGPTFCSSFPTGRTVDGNVTHHTAIAVYFSIKNTGSADTTVVAIHVGYHPRLRPLKWRFKRVWLVEQAAALGDFRVNIGGNLKVYPFLFQRNSLIPHSDNSTFVPVGGRCTGVCYWEQGESWGGYLPITDRKGRVNLKVRVVDLYNRRYTKHLRISMLPIDEARKYHPEFGMTFEALRVGPQEQSPGSAVEPLWD